MPRRENGRVRGEIFSRDFGLGVAVSKCPFSKWRYELTALIGPMSVTVGLWRNRWWR